MIGRLKIFMAAAILAITICAFQSSVAEAAADIRYVITGVELQDKQAVISGYFYNYGDSGATVTKIEFLGTVCGKDGNTLSRLKSSFDKERLKGAGYFSPQDRHTVNFTITDANIYAYNEQVYWTIGNIVYWK